MNSEACIRNYIGKQLAQRLPALSLCVGDDIRGQHSAEILFESPSNGVFERKLDWRGAELSRWDPSEIRVLRQGLIVTLAGLDRSPRRSCYFGQGDRVVRCRRGWRVVLREGFHAANQDSTKQEQVIPEFAPHLCILRHYARRIERYLLDQGVGQYLGIKTAVGELAFRIFPYQRTKVRKYSSYLLATGRIAGGRLRRRREAMFTNSAKD